MPLKGRVVLRGIIWLALAAGLIVGSLQTLVQRWGAMPLIHQAEALEDQQAASGSPVAQHAHEEHGHDHGNTWSPSDGLERQAWTWVANVNLAFALALLVFAALGIWTRRNSAPRNVLRLGLLIAASGFVSLYVWPALGLPPEIPGMDAPALCNRQGWWLLAAGSAVAAICVIAFLSAP